MARMVAIHRVPRIAMKAIWLGNFAQVAVAALTCALLTVATVQADEIKVVTYATFKPAYLELVPE